MDTKLTHGSVGASSAGALLAAALVLPASGQVTIRVSVDSGGAQGDGPSLAASISADGGYVAFESAASNLVPGDTNGAYDVFVHDRQSGTTERVSVDSSGAQANSSSSYPSISGDGRYVAFQSGATNLVPGDTNGWLDVFVHDRQSGATVRASVDPGGAQGDSESSFPSISASGGYVAFDSLATNLVPGDANGARDVFIHDLQSGVTERVSLDSLGVEGNGDSSFASTSVDGRYVAFASYATNLAPGDTNGDLDIFVHDSQSGVTERVSVDSGGTQGNDNSSAASISADGRYVAFNSFAANLVPGDTNGVRDVFVRDRQSGATERVSLDSGGAQGDDHSWFPPTISADGRYVAFRSSATNLVSGDVNGVPDVFVRDRQSSATERVSVSTGGAQGNGDSGFPSISADGHYVAFQSRATNLMPGDTNGSDDIFVRDRIGNTSFTSLCSPGAGGVMACPCSNHPSGPGRGCDNSAGTGGAILSAEGETSLSAESLVFATSGERPAALSIVLQGTSFVPTGLVFGQGVRCAGGALKRLYVKTAWGGGITAPDFFVGDPTVSARSAALGDPISSGQSRFYFVYYRDPIVLGGCPPTSTFNATQTGEVAWSP